MQESIPISFIICYITMHLLGYNVIKAVRTVQKLNFIRDKFNLNTTKQYQYGMPM